MVERVAVNHQVGGSSPSSGAKKERLMHFVVVVPFKSNFKLSKILIFDSLKCQKSNCDSGKQNAIRKIIEQIIVLNRDLVTSNSIFSKVSEVFGANPYDWLLK